MISSSGEEECTDALLVDGTTLVNGLFSFQEIILVTSFRGRRTPPSYVPISLFSRHTMASGRSAVLVEDLEDGMKAGVRADKSEGMIAVEERILDDVGKWNDDVVKEMGEQTVQKLYSQRPGQRIYVGEATHSEIR